MGEMADYIINGDDCESCGVPIGDAGPGYPRKCSDCDKEEASERRQKPTLTFMRRPYKTGVGYELIYLFSTTGGAQMEITVKDEAEADVFAKANNCVVTHRVILTEKQMAEADRAAMTKGRARLSQGYKANRHNYDKD